MPVMLSTGEKKGKNLPLVTYSLVFINIAIFYLFQQNPLVSESLVSNNLVFLPREPNLWNVPLSALSSIFLHGSHDHLWGNMMFLWAVGTEVERRIGGKPFLKLYLATGIIAGLSFISMHHIFLNRTGHALGASGAISGLMGIFAIRCYFRTMAFPVPILGILPVNIKLKMNSLVINLRDITDAVEELEQRQRWIRMKLRRKKEALEVVVENGGVPIPPGVREKIFDYFYTTKKAEKGTGMGLSTVLGIMHQHDGHVNLYSEVGLGTTFKVYFPIHESNDDDACHNVSHKKKNLNKAIGLIELAAERGAKMICLQELFNTTWFPKDINSNSFQLAERADGEVVSTMQELAKRTGTIIITPFFEEDAGKYYNSAAIIENDGSLIGTYRKVHIPGIQLYEEQHYFTGGDDFPVFDTSCGKIGVQICWDNFYPEGARALALNGAQIIFAPTAAAFASQERWKSVISANAITNGLFILRVNRVGNEEKHNFYGQTFCVDPMGEVLGEPSGTGDGLYEVDIDPAIVHRIRKDYPYLKYRRPEVYGEITAIKEEKDAQQART